MRFDRLLPEEIGAGIAEYVAHVPAEGSLVQLLATQGAEFVAELRQIPAARQGYRYAEGKWNIREVIQHIIDAERVFIYRSLCFARKDTTPLPSFDENLYAENSKSDKRKWKELWNEFMAVRLSTLLLFASFDDEQLGTTGTASGKEIQVLALGFIIAGHAKHHELILKEKYLG